MENALDQIAGHERTRRIMHCDEPGFACQLRDSARDRVLAPLAAGYELAQFAETTVEQNLEVMQPIRARDDNHFADYRAILKGRQCVTDDCATRDRREQFV